MKKSVDFLFSVFSKRGMKPWPLHVDVNGFYCFIQDKYLKEYYSSMITNDRKTTMVQHEIRLESNVAPRLNKSCATDSSRMHLESI